MVPNLIWAPDFFDPPKNLGSKKFGSREIWSLHENHQMAFSCGAQTSLGPNFLGTKFLRAQISRGPKKSGAQMRSKTISVIASKMSN